MNTQKGFAPILIILILAAALLGGYFVYTNYSNNRTKLATSPTVQPTTQSSPSPTATSPAPTGNGETANWKTYTNIRYSYSIKYSEDWYINNEASEKDFRRIDTDYLGGDTYWSNYPFRDYDPTKGEVLPNDLATIALTVNRETESITSNQFIDKVWKTPNKTKKPFKTDNMEGIQYTINEDNAGKTNYATALVTCFKKGDKFYCLNYSDIGGISDSIIQIYNKMLLTLKFTQ